MRRFTTYVLIASAILLAIVFLAPNSSSNEVIVYVSHDQDYSEPILKAFQEETGIVVKAVYDVEATKTTGLVNRLKAEKNNPRADVFWNNEFSRTIDLQNNGILEPYLSENAKDIPVTFKDPEGYWTGFAARARVLIYNKDLISEQELPSSILDLQNSEWLGRVAIANPLFGTTASHIASWYAVWGDQKAEKFIQSLKNNKMAILESNGAVRDYVVSGEFPIGLTDTDDANDAIVDGHNVGYIFLDQEENQFGSLIIPNTVMLIKNAPNPQNARKLVDYLLKKETEQKLAQSKSIQMPVRDIDVPKNVPKIAELKFMNIRFENISSKLKVSQEFIKEIFIR